MINFNAVNNFNMEDNVPQNTSLEEQKVSAASEMPTADGTTIVKTSELITTSDEELSKEQQINSISKFEDEITPKIKEMIAKANVLISQKDLNALSFKSPIEFVGFLAEFMRSGFRYDIDKGIWFFYNNTVWEPDKDKTKVMIFLKKILPCIRDYILTFNDDEKKKAVDNYIQVFESARQRKILITDLESEPVLICHAKDWNSNPELLNVKNGVINLKNPTTIFSRRPEDMMTKVADVDFNPKARSLIWENFISEICKDSSNAPSDPQGKAAFYKSAKEKSAFLQRVLGYTLFGENTEEKFFILYGPTTRNGKGTLCDAIIGVLGAGNYIFPRQPSLIASNRIVNPSSPSPELASLDGSRTIIISEPPKNMILDAAAMKTMTGNGILCVRDLHSKPFNMRCNFKILIDTNYLPQINDPTIFTSNRVLVIPFDRHFESDEQDISLKSKLKDPDVKSAILNWLIKGYQLYTMYGFTNEIPDSVRKATLNYEKISDKLGCFFDDCLEKSPDLNDVVGTMELYQKYSNFCNSSGYKADNMPTFINMLDRFCTDGRKKYRKRYPDSSSKRLVLTGYRFKSSVPAIPQVSNSAFISSLSCTSILNASTVITDGSNSNEISPSDKAVALEELPA